MTVSGNIGLHHFQKRKSIYQKYERYPSKNKWKRIIDRFIYVIVVLSPLMNLLQLIEILINKDASGVSVVSWTAFVFISLFWLLYGTVHKDKPIIISSLALAIIQTFISISAFVYR